ncbi:uncharacterized protein [Epargyreus clarus]|uniref:uncharacterized protein n=1 Tax=Epargyreus clarus TaxID=520877 RepID=UPI003C2E3681
MVQSLNSVPADVIQSQSSVGKFLMLDRDSLGAEIASLMADVDTLYQPDEGRRVIKLIEDLSEFPNTPKTPKEIVHEMMDAVILAPFKRMYGTTKEKLIVKQLDELVIRLFFSGYPVPRRRYSGKQTTEQTRKKKNITTWNQRTKKIKTLPTPLTKLTTTKLTTIPNKYAAFSKNETIKKAFKYRLNRYRMKRDPNRWRQWRSKHTTTTTTTEKPTRVTRKVKSKYVIKRYVLKKMKKRKVKIFQNETGTFELVDFEDDLDGVEKTPIKEKYFQKTLNKNGVSTKEDNIVEDSSVTDEEKLKANLDDALFHEKPIRNSDFRNFGRRKIESSYSDDETVLKSRIYKVFGYEDDFAEALRQGKNRRQRFDNDIVREWV